MIEKKLGTIHVSNLRTILLLEADFNIDYKIIFNMRLIPTLEYLYVILQEIIGGCRA